MQTEPPYWLEEAYRDSGIATSDTDIFWRATNNLALIWLMCRLLGISGAARIIDFGGGTGFLCRMLRDHGFDARLLDRYSRNEAARGFDDDGSVPDLISAFEVVEHFAEPQDDMKQILGRGAPVCIVGTETYQGQGSDWWYIAPHMGQHVFFYSEQAMQMLAERHGYAYRRIWKFHFFFHRPPRRWRMSLARRCLQPMPMSLIRAYLAYRLPHRFAEADGRAVIRRATEPTK